MLSLLSLHIRVLIVLWCLLRVMRGMNCIHEVRCDETDTCQTQADIPRHTQCLHHAHTHGEGNSGRHPASICLEIPPQPCHHGQSPRTHDAPPPNPLGPGVWGMVPKDGPGTAVHSCGACWWAGVLTTASKEDTPPWTECEYSERRYFCNALTMNGAERRRYYCNALPASHTLVS